MVKVLILFLMGYVFFVFDISLWLFKQENKLTIPEESTTSNSASSSPKNMTEDDQRSFLLLDEKENLQVRQNLE